jgi:hypothetical protein
MMRNAVAVPLSNYVTRPRPLTTDVRKERQVRKLIMAGVAVAALAVPTAALAQGGGNVTCTDNSLAGTTVNSNVTVPAGAHCDLSWATVTGNVNVAGSLTTFGQTHFEGNVIVNGGSFAGANWGVTIDKNLQFTDPATYSYNGFWGDYSPNVVKGQITYTITSATNYPPSQAPVLYFHDTTAGGFSYSDNGLGQHRAPDTRGLSIAA